MKKAQAANAQAYQGLRSAVSSAKRICVSAFAAICVLGLAACGSSSPSRPAPGPQGPIVSPDAGGDRAGDVQRPKELERRDPGLTPPHMAQRDLIRIGVMLPFSAPQQAAREEAESLMQAAELALFDYAKNNVILMPKDSGSTPEQAEAAARALVAQGADVIIGPLFSQSVTAAAPIARNARTPMIAFSTDRSVAGGGIYLLSYQVEEEIDRVFEFAGRKGIRQIALYAPESDYGRLAEKATRVFTAQRSLGLGPIQYFPRSDRTMGPSAKAIADQLRVSPPGSTALLLPERGLTLRSAAPLLIVSGLDPKRTRLLGTGLWAEGDVFREPSLAGAWFASVDPASALRAGFEQRFRAAYGKPPKRLAALSYDATALIANLANEKGEAGVTYSEIESVQGFVGVDGLFRFRRDGGVQRGLAILEMTTSGPRVIEPAPKAFLPGS